MPDGTSTGRHRAVARPEKAFLTINGAYVLARIHESGLRVWRPRTAGGSGLVLLDDVLGTSMNPLVVNLLIEDGFLEEADETLVVTQAGVAALAARPDMLSNIRAAAR